VWQGNRTTNNTGWFNITDVPVGTYDIGIKNWTCLSEVVSNVTVIGGVGAVVDFGTTREGDVNNDDYVGLDDYTLIVAAYDSVPGSGNWNDCCDFNRDSYVGLDDYTVLVNHYDMIGELLER